MIGYNPPCPECGHSYHLILYLGTPRNEPDLVQCQRCGYEWVEDWSVR